MAFGSESRMVEGFQGVVDMFESIPMGSIQRFEFDAPVTAWAVGARE